MPTKFNELKEYTNLIHQLFRDKHYTPKQIADELSVKLHKIVFPEAVLQILKSDRVNGETHDIATVSNRYNTWTKEEDNTLLALKSKNLTFKEISSVFEVNFHKKLSTNALSKRYCRIHKTSTHKSKHNYQQKNKLKAKDTSKKEKQAYSFEEIAKQSNSNKDTSPVKPLTTGVDVYHKKDGTDHLESTLEVIDAERYKDEKFILQAFGYDPKKWHIIRNRSNFWQTPSQEFGHKTMWQVKIDIEPLGSKAIDADDLIDLFNKHTVKKVTINPQTKEDIDRNLVLSFADLHFGITTYKTMLPYMQELVALLRSRSYKTIVIEQLGDLFHSDSLTTIRTNSGTLLSTDGKEVNIVDAINEALYFYTTIIEEALANTSQVRIYHTQGNHSADLEYMFLMVLEQRYPQVEIHKNIQYRTAYMLDNVGIMLAHGDTAKSRLPMLFANEYSDIWAASTYRTIHSGHYHKQVVNDENGVVWYQVGTPKPTDGYELKNGFTMAHKRLQVFEYNKNSLKAAYYLGGDNKATIKSAISANL